MKYARVAFTIGQVAPTPIANGERDMILKWISQPTAITRSVFMPLPSLGGHERDVGVLERRLARGDAADGRAAQLGEQRLRQLARARRLDDEELLLLLLLDRDRSHPVDRPQPLDGGVVDAEHLDLRDAAVGDAALQLGRRPLPHDAALRDYRDPVAERVGLEHVVRRQQQRLAGADELGDRRPQLARAHWVDADRRLVEEQDFRVVEDPARDVEPLPHPSGVALDALLLTAGEPDELEHLADPLALAAAGDAVQL